MCFNICQQFSRLGMQQHFSNYGIITKFCVWIGITIKDLQFVMIELEQLCYFKLFNARIFSCQGESIGLGI
jgi:hypothetical protein